MRVILAGLVFLGFCSGISAMHTGRRDLIVRIPQPPILDDRLYYPERALPTPSNSWLQAASKGEIDTCLNHIKRGQKIDSRDKDGWSALLWAAKNGHSELCKLLLKEALRTQLSVRYYLLCLRKLSSLGDKAAYFLYQQRETFVKPNLSDYIVSIELLLAAEVSIEDYFFEGRRIPGVKLYEKTAYDFSPMRFLHWVVLKETKSELRRLLREESTKVQ